MSRSEDAAGFADMARDLSAHCAAAIEDDALDSVPDEALGQLFASVLRLYAAKVQAGHKLRPFGGNSGVTVTDVTIGCTAMLDSVSLSVFELGSWQTFSGLGSLDRS